MPSRRQLFGFDQNVFLLGIASLLNDTSSEMIYPLLPLFLTTVLGGGPADIGVIEGVAETTASLLKPVAGWLSDRLGRRKPLVIGGYGLAVLSRPLIALASAPWHVLLIRFSDRTGKGLRTAPRDALLADSSVESTWGRAFGFHRAMDHLGAVFGPLLAYALLAGDRLDTRVVFALAAIPGMVALPVLVFGVRETPPNVVVADAPSAPSGPLPQSLWRFVLVVFVFTLGNSSDAFLLLRAQDVGISAASLPLLWVWLHVVKSLSSVPGSGLSDRLGRRRVIFLGWTLYAAVYLGFAQATTPWAVWVLFGVYGLFFGLTEGTEKALVADLVAVQRRGAAFGVYHLAIGLAALPASVLFGLLWKWSGPALAFCVGAGLATAAAALLMLLVPSPPPVHR